MEVKHKDCFIPRIVEHYGLAAVARHFREVAEFLNLYSRWRGINRFPGLVMTVDLLADHPAMVGRPIALPALAGLRAWLAPRPAWAIRHSPPRSPGPATPTWRPPSPGARP